VRANCADRFRDGRVFLAGDAAHVVLEPGSPPLHEHPRESAGRPGARAPHVFLDRAGTRLSTLDLFGRNFVLLTGPSGRTWRDAAATAVEGLGVALDVHVVGGPALADPEGCFPGAYGISPSGAVLVRPDGFVGWRAADAAGAAEETLRQALQALLCRGDGKP
jgi:putative polyketide hydroxylase